MDKHRFQTTPPGDLPIFLKRLASVSARRASARRGRSGSIHEIRVILCGAISQLHRALRRFSGDVVAQASRLCVSVKLSPVAKTHRRDACATLFAA
jgi:hypothetical protein